MGKKSQLISKIMFSVSLLLFVVFAVAVLFGGQKIAGSIYFIFFTISLAFAFLDKKYNSNFFQFYRYSIYLDDLINIFAISSIIYHGQDVWYMIAVLCLVGIGLFVDLLSKNRFEKRRLESILVSFANLALMFVIFPYFFFKTIHNAVPIIAVVVVSVVAVLKIVLEIIPVKVRAEEEEAESLIEKQVSVKSETEHNVE